jgi:hypothetical protein
VVSRHDEIFLWIPSSLLRGGFTRVESAVYFNHTGRVVAQGLPGGKGLGTTGSEKRRGTETEPDGSGSPDA